MGMESKITSKGQTTIPSDVRAALELSEGDTLLYVPCDDGSFQIYRKNLKISSLAGMLGKAANGNSFPGDILNEAIEEAINDEVRERNVHVKNRNKEH